MQLRDYLLFSIAIMRRNMAPDAWVVVGYPTKALPKVPCRAATIRYLMQ